MTNSDIQHTRKLFQETFLRETAQFRGDFAWVCDEAGSSLKSGQYQLALELLDLLWAIGRRQQAVQHARAICFFALKQFRQAEAALRVELDLQPGNQDARDLLLLIQEQQKDSRVKPSSLAFELEKLILLAEFCLGMRLHQSAMVLFTAFLDWQPCHTRAQYGAKTCRINAGIDRHKQTFEDLYSKFDVSVSAPM
jgi:hypothetical protein